MGPHTQQLVTAYLTHLPARQSAPATLQAPIDGRNRFCRLVPAGRQPHLSQALASTTAEDLEAWLRRALRTPGARNLVEVLIRTATYANDPSRLSAGAGLRQLKALYVDCGTLDQYNLLYGARRLHRLLEQRGIAHIYEEFKDDHSSTDYRLDRSLPLLAQALS